ncbi:MAG: hypothetical protein QME69_09610 [Candidatus Saccharicenans sp.]|nr:hypothetical protein [Candidatus Saccharicenans sp.]
MKVKSYWVSGFWLVFLLAVAINPLSAQQSQDVTFQVTLAEWYDLYIGTNTVTFADIAPSVGATPGTVQIAANENPVAVRVFAIMVPASSLNLTVTAAGDFHPTVPASTVSWTVSGSGYQAGSLLAGNAVPVGQWTGSIFHWHEGQLNFSFLRDYVNQEPGTYSITATYTLSKI